jgi:hypothetical protein
MIIAAVGLLAATHISNELNQSRLVKRAAGKDFPRRGVWRRYRMD